MNGAATGVVLENGDLRVVQVFRGTPLSEHTLPFTTGAAVTVGSAPGNTFTIPETPLGDSFRLFQAGITGFILTIAPGMSGTLHLEGKATSVRAPSLMFEHPIGEGDWGIISLDDKGDVAFFFQRTAPAPRVVQNRFKFDGFNLSAFLMAFYLLSAVVVVAFIITDDNAEEDLAAQPERIARLMLDKEWPAKPDPEEKRKTEERSEIRKVKAEDSSKRAAGKEGKVGDPNKKGETRLAKTPKDALVEKVRNVGTLGVIKAVKGDSALGRLISSEKDLGYQGAMAGLPGVKTEIGYGSGGMGTKGGGTGGGGHGTGQLHGIGNLQTGGGGNGKSPHPGGGAGRVEKEVSVSVGKSDAGVDGSLTREQIYKVVASHIGAIQFCFEKELQRFPKLTGKVSLTWRVELDGSVSAAKVGSSTLSHPPTEGCMVRQLKTWQFPKPQGTVAQVSFPFLFRGR